MHATGRLPGAPCTSTIVWSIVLAAQVACARDDDDFAPVVVFDQPQVVFAEENFDQWVFGGRTVAATRGRLDSQLAIRIEAVAQVGELTDAQRQKFQLAGRGDIRRFLDRVEEQRKKFLLVRKDQNKIGELWQEIQPLQMTINAGLHGDGSLFAKTLKTILAAEPYARYEEAERERRVFHYRARVELVVGLLDDVLALGDERRRNLVDLVVNETRIPRSFGQYDHYVVLLQMSRLPEERLKMVFDASQWRRFDRQRRQFQGMEPFLKQNGFLPDSRDDAQEMPATGRRAD
jgi:hypothetical protein